MYKRGERRNGTKTTSGQFMLVDTINKTNKSFKLNIKKGNSTLRNQIYILPNQYNSLNELQHYQRLLTYHHESFHEYH